MKIFTRVDTDQIKQTLAIYRQELKGERKQFILACIFVPLQNFLYIVFLPLIISFFTQSLITHPHDIQIPLILVGVMVGASALALWAGHLGFITLFNHEERMSTRLGERALSGLLAHSYSFFANSKVGSLAGDVNTFSRSYVSALDAAFLQATSIVINFVTSLIVIAFIAPIMLPVLFALTFLVIYDTLRSFSKRSVYRNQRKELMSRLSGSIADILGNQTLVRMFGHAARETRQIVAQRKQIEAVAKKEINILQQGAETRMGIVFIFQILTLLLCLWFISQSWLSIAALIFIITYLGRVSGTMFSIGSIVRSIEQAFLDAAKITEILNKTPDVLDHAHATKMHVVSGSIDLHNVTFSYESSLDHAVFADLNLSVKPGQTLGLAGKSGGGKSTLTHLLLRYMDIQAGEIMIDGQNIADVTQDSLRAQIAYVPQDPFLFHRTLRENIAYGKPEVSDEEVLSAAEKAYAMEFIDKLPDGLDTVVGERGVKLSGGQRQRIAIARALLKDAPILILDEATSALDSESEKLIQASLETLMKGRTSIIIAHRLSTIAKLDRIIVLDQGQIVEDGKHAELLEKNGVYAKLWKHQSGGFIED